jgi:hypothetical protein
MSKQLYEQDFILWCESTAEKIRKADLMGLAGRDRRELASRLVTLYEHLLKRYYLDLPNNYRGWGLTILRTKLEIKDILKTSPSLKKFFAEIFEECFEKARKLVVKEYNVCDLPSNNPFPKNIELLLSEEDD